MTTRSISLVIPGLFGPASAHARAWEDMKLPALEQWLARAACTPTRSSDFEHGLFEAFGVDVPDEDDAPVAAVTRQWDKGDAGDHYWLRADPVHLRADRDRLVMLGNTSLTLTPDEQAQLVDELNVLLSEDGYVLDAANARRWYLRAPRDPALCTTSLGDAIGQDVLHCMPRGADARRWRGLLNEVQMVLHASPVNQAREAARLTPINSLWFWGGGRLPPSASAAWSQVWSNEALAAGLAALTHTPCASLPADADEWLQDDTAGAQLVVIDGAREAAHMGDVEAWQAFLHALHEAWLAPLYEAVKRRRVAQATLYAADGRAFRLDARAARRWWVRARPIATWDGRRA